jgi:hypothetical protein
MKKILIATNVLLLGIILVQACSQKNDRNKKAETDARLAIPLDSCLARVCSGFGSTDFKGQISFELATQMSRDYNAGTGKNLIWKGSQMTRTEDASSVVFDLATLKKYIWYIESNVCRRGCTNKGLQLGIRFYYAQYPDANIMRKNDDLNTLDLNYADRHTLFMVPVYRFMFTKGIYKNFNPLAVRGCEFLWDGTDTVPVPVLIALGGDDPDQENHGSLRPPPAGSGVFPNN